MFESGGAEVGELADDSGPSDLSFAEGGADDVESEHVGLADCGDFFDVEVDGHGAEMGHDGFGAFEASERVGSVQDDGDSVGTELFDGRAEGGGRESVVVFDGDFETRMIVAVVDHQPNEITARSNRKFEVVQQMDANDPASGFDLNALRNHSVKRPGQILAELNGVNVVAHRPGDEFVNAHTTGGDIAGKGVSGHAIPNAGHR